MKWIKIVFGTLIGLVVVAFCILAILNSRPDAGRLRTSVVIHQRPEQVWPWLYEPDKLKRWVSWLVAVKGDSSGPPMLGTRSVWVMQDRNNHNAQMEITSRVESVEPAKRLTVDLSSAESFQGKASYVLTDLGDGQTRLESDSSYVFENRFARFMTPLVMQAAGKKMAGDLDRLRSLVEAGR